MSAEELLCEDRVLRTLGLWCGPVHGGACPQQLANEQMGVMVCSQAFSMFSSWSLGKYILNTLNTPLKRIYKRF